MATALTARSVEAAKPDPNKRREIPDGLLVGMYLVVQPSGLKSWAVRYRQGDKPRKLTLGSYPAFDLATARKAARDALQAVAEGKDPAGEKQAARRATPPKVWTFRDVADQFIEKYAKPRKRSWQEDKRILEVYVLPKWGDKAVTEIDRADVDELVEGVATKGAAGKKPAPIQANRVLAVTRKLFNWAIAKPRFKIDVSPVERIAAPGAETSRDRVLGDDELCAVWLAAEHIGWPYSGIVRMLIVTGQRRAEVGEMAFTEVNGDMWTIPGARSKNGEPHEVPLTGLAKGILGERPHTGASPLVFPAANIRTQNEHGKKAVRAFSGYSKAKAKLDETMLLIRRKDDEDAKIEPWTIHDIRRTVATGMARLGIAPHVVEKVLNHVTGQISGVAAVYNRHAHTDEKRNALETWERYINGLLNPSADTNVVPLHREESAR